MSSRQPLDTRIYRGSFSLFPAAFRRDFSEDMLRDFEDDRHEAATSGHAAFIWVFRMRMLRDFTRTLGVQWVRTGWPLIGALAMMLTLMSTTAVASVLSRMDLRLPSGSPDEEVIAVMMLTVVVLLFIVATILLTMWSGRIVRRSARRRA